jgi:uncharacterized protein (DUF302 family)
VFLEEISMKTLSVTQVPVERLSLPSDKPFECVLVAIRGAIGHPEMDTFWQQIWRADSFEAVESIVNPSLGPTGLMQFQEFDDGGFIRKHRGEKTPQSRRLLIGNPLIMKQMTELVPDAAAYAPVTILVDEREGKVYVSYDRMTSLLSVYNNPEAIKIADSLDTKIETLMREAV